MVNSTNSSSQALIHIYSVKGSKQIPGVAIAATNILNQWINLTVDSVIPKKNEEEMVIPPEITDTTASQGSIEILDRKGIQDKKRANAADLRNYIIIASVGITGWIFVMILLVERFILLYVKKKPYPDISNSTIPKENETAKNKNAKVEDKENQTANSTELLPSTEPDKRANSPMYP